MTRPEFTPIVLPVQGMTCAACVRRVEKALGSVPGVSSVAVNLATERATVVADSALLPQLRKAALDAGYDLLLPAGAEGGAQTPPDQAATLRRDLLIALGFSVPVMSISMTGVYASADRFRPSRDPRPSLSPHVSGSGRPGRRFFEGRWARCATGRRT